ncbi:ead/Ea22-like family protein [Salmonella enterica]|nr:ead/Ea22-like family protein [Salmonella enterica]
MTALNKQALREAAEKALPAMKRLLMMTNDELFDEALLNVDGDVDAANAFNLLAGPETVLALLDELEAAEKRIEEGICRANREHHRGFMMACNHLKEHANVHYADAAEMEIAALRQRIAELEARTVTLPPKEHDNGTDSQIDINAGFANRMWQKCADAIRAAGIGVKGE